VRASGPKARRCAAKHCPDYRPPGCFSYTIEVPATDVGEIVMQRFVPPITRRGVLLAGSAIVVAGAAADAQESHAGTIEAVRGDAYAEGAKPRRALQLMAELFIGDLVETAVNSALTMHLGKSTFVKLGALAKFRIDDFVIDAGGTFDLEQGPLLIDHSHDGTNDNLQVRSPFGLIAVRGTRFFAGPSNDVFGVFVAQGLVSVTGGGRTVTLRPGLGTNIANPGDVPTEPRRWGPGRITAALRSVE
jgi:ferric-dicitrate binding protein FerR (iron transport regulator)